MVMYRIIKRYHADNRLHSEVTTTLEKALGEVQRGKSTNRTDKTKLKRQLSDHGRCRYTDRECDHGYHRYLEVSIKKIFCQRDY